MTTLTTEQKIAAAGYTMQEAREFITAVVDRPGAVVASAGVWPAQPVVRVPIRHGGEILHVLALGPRRDGERSDPREVADLEALAELAAAAAAAASGGASGRS